MKIFITILCVLMPSMLWAFTNHPIASYHDDNNIFFIPAIRHVTSKHDVPQDQTKSYSLRFSLNENQFTVEEIKPIPNFQYDVQSLYLGSTREMVLEALGDPMNKREMLLYDLAMGPRPLNLTAGTPYEEWEYIVDDVVYLVWFAATSDLPKEDWILQDTTLYPVNANF